MSCFDSIWSSLDKARLHGRGKTEKLFQLGAAVLEHRLSSMQPVRDAWFPRMCCDVCVLCFPVEGTYWSSRTPLLCVVFEDENEW